MRCVGEKNGQRMKPNRHGPRLTCMTTSRRTLAVCCATLIGAGLGGCAQRGQDSSAGVGDVWPAGRTFVATTITEDGRAHPLVTGTRLTLTFAANHTLNASAGCNTMSGQGRVSGGALVVDPLAQTEMGCDTARMAQDQWVSAFLGGKPTVDLAGEALTLHGGGVRIELVNDKTTNPDRPLAGTRWVVTSLVSGETVSSVPADAGEAALVIDAAGTFTGTTGCGSVKGDVTIAGKSVTFSNTTGFDVTCAHAEVRGAMAVALLRGPVRFSITGDQLTLLGRDGTGLTFTAKA